MTAILTPLSGAAFCLWIRDPDRARMAAVYSSAACLASSLAAWGFFAMASPETSIPGSPGWPGAWISLDQLSAPLLPLAALLWVFTSLVTPRSKLNRFSFPHALILESLTIATLACREPWGVVLLLVAGTLIPWSELRYRKQPSRLYGLHMGLFSLLLVLGQLIEDYEGQARFTRWWAALPLLAAVLIRCGVVPFHLWIGRLFEGASFGLSILFVTPMLGAYACVRLVLPIAPDWMLRGLALVSVGTALYCGGLAVVQREGRRLFSCMFLSHSALVLVGLEMVTELGLTGALCLWLSAGLSLGSFALTLRAVESRRGRVDLVRLGGLYSSAPILAIMFVLTGLACVGFPGTIGFVATELLFDGVVEAYPFSGAAVVVASTLNGVAIIRAFFRIFAGATPNSGISLQILPREKLVVLTLAALIVLGGIYPQPGVRSRHDAALDLLSHRDSALVEEAPHTLQRIDHQRHDEPLHLESDLQHEPAVER
ncbi:MAG: proton-conducting transporter membrane subunit [Planctomycetaceae bacterium]